MAIHVFLRPVGRLVDRAPAGGDDDLSSYLLILDVRRKHEPHLRAQLLQALAAADVTLRGLSSHTSDEDSATVTTLQADLLIEGPATRQLDTLVTRLSLEPGVRTVSWQNQDPETHDTEDRDDRPPPRLRGIRWRNTLS